MEQLAKTIDQMINILYKASEAIVKEANRLERDIKCLKNKQLQTKALAADIERLKSKRETLDNRD